MLEYSELSILRKPFYVVLYVAKILVAYVRTLCAQTENRMPGTFNTPTLFPAL